MAFGNVECLIKEQFTFGKVKRKEKEQFSHRFMGLVGLERCLWQGKWYFYDTYT